MIIELFAILLVVALTMLIGGYFINGPILQIMGCLLLFILGINIMSGGLAYPTGNTILEGTPTIISNTYTSWNESNSATITGNIKDYHTTGFYFILTGILSFVVVLSDIRGWGRREE